MRRLIRVVLACLMLATVHPSDAVEPAYLADWPPVERVLADHQATDRTDTLARQMAALHQLSLAIDELAGPRRWREGHTPDEQRLRGQYDAAAEAIRSEVHATLPNELGPGFHGPFAKAPLRKWYALQWKYESDPAGRRATLSRYLPADLIAEFETAVGSVPDEPAGPREWRWLLWAGLGFVALALLQLLARGWQRRRNGGTVTARAPASQVDTAGLHEAAALDVLDSLEPYIAAARVDGKPVTVDRMLQPYAFGFIFYYCTFALEARGGTSQGEEGPRKVLELLFRNPRWAGLVVLGTRDTVLRQNEGKDGRASRLAGMLMASMVLRAYANPEVGDRGLSSTMLERIAQKAGRQADELTLRNPPPATRLHPPSRRSDDLQRVILHTFTRKLVDPHAADD